MKKIKIINMKKIKIINATAYNTEDLQAFCIACVKLSPRLAAHSLVKEILFVPMTYTDPYQSNLFSNYGDWHEKIVEIKLQRPSRLKINALVALAQAADGAELSLSNEHVLKLAELVMRVLGGDIFVRGAYPRRTKKSRGYKKLYAMKVHYTLRAPNGVGKAHNTAKAKIAMANLVTEVTRTDWKLSNARHAIGRAKRILHNSHVDLWYWEKERAKRKKELKAKRELIKKLVKEMKK